MDLNELVKGRQELAATKQAFNEVGDAAAGAAAKVDAATLKLDSTYRTRAAMTKQQFGAETKAAADEAAKQDAIAAASLATNIRMARQRAVEAAAAAAEETRAAEESAKAQERARLYLQGVKIRSLAMEEADRKAALAVEAADVQRQISMQEKAAAYIQGIKIRYFRQAQAEQEKAEALSAATSARAAARLEAQQASFLAGLNKRNVEQTNTTTGQRAYLELRAAQLGVTEAAKPMIDGLKATEQALGHVSGQAIKVREAFVLIREFMRGDFSRMAGSASILAGAFGALKPAILPFTLALLGLGAVIGGVIAAITKMENEASRLANALSVTNDAVGLTSANIMAMARNLATANDTGMSKTVELLTTLAATGEVSASSLQTVADASLQLSRLTGQAADKIGNELLKSFDDASKGAIDLNNRYHFLTLSEYEQIDALQKAGDKQGAFNALMQDLDIHLHTVTPQVGTFARVWNQVTEAVDGAVRALGRIGVAQDNQAKLEADAKKAAAYDKNPFSRNSPQAQAVRARLATEVGIAADQQRATYDQAARDETQKKGIDAQRANEAMNRRLKGNSVDIAEAISNYQANNAAALAADPNDAKALDDKAHMAERIARIRKLMGTPGGRRAGSLDGTRNRLGAQEGQISGLLADILNPATDPISEFQDQIRTAGLQAAGGFQFGKRAPFQQRAAENAEQVKRLEIFKSINAELAKQIDAERQQQQVEKIMFDAQTEAAKAQDAYFQSGQTGIAGDIRLQQELIDIQAKAKEQADTLAVLQKYGGPDVTSVDQLQARLLTLANGNQQVADATMGRVRADIAAKVSGDEQTATNQKEKVSQDALTGALRDYDALQRSLRDDLFFAGATPAEREAKGWILAKAKIYEAQGATHEYALQLASAEGVLKQQVQDWAKITAQISDSVRQGFIDTGKLDFKSLKDGVTRALRQAVYDALLAKPITVVVNAVMNIATDAIQKLLSNVLGSGDAGGGGFLSAIGSFLGLGKSSSATGAANIANDDYAAMASQAASSIGAASVGLSKAAGLLGSVAALAGPAFLGSQLGGATNRAFGIPNNTGSAIGGALGGAGGYVLGSALGVGTAITGTSILGLSGAVLGPIGLVVGAILGAALGGLLGGKPSNFTASGKTDGGGGFIYGGDKPNADTSKAAQALGAAITSSMDALLKAGITPTESVTGFEIGQRDSTKVTLSSGLTLQSAVGDPAKAANGAMLELLKTATYANEAEKTFVDGLIATGAAFDAIITSLQKFDEAQKFGEGIGRSILQYTDPQSYALANLADTQAARAKQLQSYAAQGLLSPSQVSTFAKQLQQLDSLEIADTMKQFAGSVVDATHSLADFQREQQKIKDFVTGLSSGNLSPLSPADKLAYDQGVYGSNLAKAKGNDFTALSGITTDAQNYLSDAQSFYGSTSAYNDIFNQVQSQLSDLGNQTFADPVVTGLSDVQGAVTQSGADIVAALQAATAAILKQLADAAAITVAATTDGLSAIVQTSVDTSTFNIGLIGGSAGNPGVSISPTPQIALGGGGFGGGDFIGSVQAF